MLGVLLVGGSRVTEYVVDRDTGVVHVASPLEQSEGHLAFAGAFEFFTHGSAADVYRAPLRAPVMVSNGVRGGGRWESTASWWDRYGQATINALGAPLVRT